MPSSINYVCIKIHYYDIIIQLQMTCQIHKIKSVIFCVQFFVNKLKSCSLNRTILFLFCKQEQFTKMINKISPKKFPKRSLHSMLHNFGKIRRFTLTPQMTVVYSLHTVYIAATTVFYSGAKH